MIECSLQKFELLGEEELRVYNNLDKLQRQTTPDHLTGILFHVDDFSLHDENLSRVVFFSKEGIYFKIKEKEKKKRDLRWIKCSLSLQKQHFEFPIAFLEDVEAMSFYIYKENLFRYYCLYHKH